MKRAIVSLSFFAFSLFVMPASSEAYRVARDFVQAHADFLRVFQGHETNASVRYLIQPNTQEGNGPGEFNLHMIDAKVGVAFPLTRNLFISPKLTYRASVYDFNGLANETLHAIALPITAGLFLSDRWMIMGAFRPGLFSDLDASPNRDDWIFQGNGLIAYQWTEDLIVMLGAAISEDFEESRAIPLGGVKWYPKRSSWYVDALLPAVVEVGYGINNRFRTYVTGGVTGEQYHARIGGTELDVQTQDWRAGVGFDYQLNDKLMANVEGGLYGGNQFEFSVPTVGQFTRELDPTGYASISFGYNY